MSLIGEVNTPQLAQTRTLVFIDEGGNRDEFMLRATFMPKSAYLLIHQQIEQKNWVSIEIDGVMHEINYSRRQPVFKEESTEFWLVKT